MRDHNFPTLQGFSLLSKGPKVEEQRREGRRLKCPSLHPGGRSLWGCLLDTGRRKEASPEATGQVVVQALPQVRGHPSSLATSLLLREFWNADHPRHPGEAGQQAGLTAWLLLPQHRREGPREGPWTQQGP